MGFRELIARGTGFARMKRTDFTLNRTARKGITDINFGPSSLNLLMIDSCNSACIMCGSDYRNCGSAERLTLGKIKKIFGHLDANQLIEVIYGGGGEPFLNPELSEIAAFTRRRCPTVSHSVITNFIAFDEATVRTLLENRVNFLISLNAATEKTYRQISGIPAFAQVCNHIRELVRLRRRLRSMSGISISIILMKQNIGELGSFIKLASDIGIDGVKAVYVRIYPKEFRQKADGSIQISPEDSLYFHQEESNLAVSEAIALADRLNMKLDYQPLFGQNCIMERDCKEPWRSLFIAPGGELYPCAAGEILFMNKVATGQYDSGNILKHSIDDFWNNRFWKALRETNRESKRNEIVPECRCCGMSINWLGVDSQNAHIMDWTLASKSRLKL